MSAKPEKPALRPRSAELRRIETHLRYEFPDAKSISVECSQTLIRNSVGACFTSFYTARLTINGHTYTAAGDSLDALMRDLCPDEAA